MRRIWHSARFRSALIVVAAGLYLLSTGIHWTLAYWLPVIGAFAMAWVPELRALYASRRDSPRRRSQSE